MTKEIRLNAFDMNCVGHIQHGMWTHPRDRSTEYNTIRWFRSTGRVKYDRIDRRVRIASMASIASLAVRLTPITTGVQSD